MNDTEESTTMDMQLPKKRMSRVTPAMLPYDRRGRLLTQYLQCYKMDSRFCRALSALFSQHRDTILAIVTPSSWMDIMGDTTLDRAFAQRPGVPLQNPSLIAYADSVIAFVKRWKLDLISGGEGYDAVHGWCIEQHYFRNPPRVDLFPLGLVFGGWKPEVGVAVQEEATAVDQYGNQLLVTGERCIPRVRVVVEDMWEAGYETLQQAKTRLDKQYEEKKKAAFAALRQQYEGAGYIFPSGQRHEVPKHINWTYLHVARGQSYVKIAMSENGVNEEGIRKKVKEYAGIIGLALSTSKNRTP